MFWLEMSLDKQHGGGDWGFSKTLWSPTRRTNGYKSAFWETVNKVRAGDSILHLRNIEDGKAFVGFSTADADSYETFERPPEPGEWLSASAFYRVDLRDYRPFSAPIDLDKVFSFKDEVLRAYYKDNQTWKSDKRHIFYTIRDGEIVCSQGAYLSEVDNQLASILLDYRFEDDIPILDDMVHDVATAERLREFATRVGQNNFSNKIRSNYHTQCCFPNCPINEGNFLVGSHIARWADNPELRGKIANGLCLCLMHDKAFEAGFFTLDENYCVKINRSNHEVANSPWCKTQLEPYEGQSIKLGGVRPSEEAILLHWIRIGYLP